VLLGALERRYDGFRREGFAPQYLPAAITGGAPFVSGGRCAEAVVHATGSSESN